MARTFGEQGPDKGEAARRPAGSADTGGEEPLTPSEAAVSGPAAPPRPARTTPGGSGLAALLMQNRAKTGKQKILESEGAVPERTRSPTGSFDLLDITAVGGAGVTEDNPDPKVQTKAGETSRPVDATGARGGEGETTLPRRTSHPTPGGGLPGLLMRTQLGLGDAVRAFRDSEREKQGRTQVPPATLAPLRSTPSAAVDFEASETSAGGSVPAAGGDGEKTDVTVPVEASMESAPAGTTVNNDAVSEAPEGSGRPTSEASTGEASAVEAGGGVVAPSSGPVFQLGTGRVGEAGVGASGPVFDLISGPLAATDSAPSGLPAAGAELSGPSEAAPVSAASASSHPTPTNGRLAALLAESRKRSGRHETLAKAGPTAAATEPSSTSSVTEGGPNDIATVRVPGASLAEKRGPGFAATLLGLPGPEQKAMEAALASVRDAVANASSGAGRAVSTRSGGEAGQNPPLPIEGEATERSLLSTADVRRGWQGRTGEEKRITEIVDVVRPARAARIKAAVAIAGGVLAIACVIFLGSLRKPKRGPSPPQPTLGARLGAPGRESSQPPAGVPGNEVPVRTADEPMARGGPPAVPAAPSVPDPVAAEKSAGQDEGAPSRVPPPAAATEEATPASGDGDSPPARVASAGDAGSTRERETKRTAAHVGPRRSESGRGEAKTRRRNSEGRAARAVSEPVAAEAPRTRLTQPSRTPESDPDGTLPLGIR